MGINKKAAQREQFLAVRNTDTRAAVQKLQSNANAYALKLVPTLDRIIREGVTSQHGIADQFDIEPVKKRRGKRVWQPTDIRNLRKRLKRILEEDGSALTNHESGLSDSFLGWLKG